MIAVLKSGFALFLAMIVAFALIIAVEGVSAVMHPFPPGVDPHDLEACKAHVARYPAVALVMAVSGWGFTVLSSCWIATRLGTGRHPAHGLAMGLFLCAAAAFNLALLPYPLWFELAIAVVFPVAIVMANRWGRQPTVSSLPAESPS